MLQTIQRFFAVDGELSRQQPAYRPRGAQVDMALAVADTIQRNGVLVAEAGTGTGKTFAYLVPAALSGKKVIVSTATKTLQDQLFRKDLPVVRQTVNRPVRTALLKGRSNYLCLYRLEHILGFKVGHGFQDARGLDVIRRWAKTTQLGDIAEVRSVPDNSPLWSGVTSTADNCLGQECPSHADCFLVKARNRAREADILVINHHLLWADWTLRSDGFGELLPEAEVIIVDEAHQFLESASQFLGLTLSYRQLADLAGDIRAECLKNGLALPPLLNGAEQLEKQLDDVRLALGEGSRREAWVTVEEDATEALQAIRTQLTLLSEMLGPLAVRSKGLESCRKRCGELGTRLDEFCADDEANAIRWFETFKRGFSLSRTPLEFAGEFARFRAASRAAWVFASATLSVRGGFDHFVRQLGLAGARCECWESPFNYSRNCLLYCPPGMADPADPGYTQAVMDVTLPVLQASRGRAFMLFTSHKALQQAAAFLSSRVDFPLFVQGTQPKTVLLESFKAAGNGVLLGTSTFWEGVDVPGPALSCVIIDKLPFASPSDPVLAARLERLRRNGQQPFFIQQLPAAIIALKQGVGRLIRGQEDRGVLVLCDPRLQSKPYGRQFLSSLPAMSRTRSIDDVERFFAVDTVT